MNDAELVCGDCSIEHARILTGTLQAVAASLLAECDAPLPPRPGHP
jgi:hypothetical protein